MEPKVLMKQDLTPWLEALASKWELIAPVAEDGVTRYRVVKDISSVDLDCPRPANTLREHFVPETETLFEYDFSGEETKLSPAIPTPKDRLIFGARACDAAALRYVDAVYSNVEPVDVPYFERRKHTAVVGIFCVNPHWSCFCTEVNAFLTNPIEMDVYLVDLGDRFYVEIFTPKGEEIASGSFFQPATEADKQAAQNVRAGVLARLPKPVDHATTCASYDWDSPIWLKLAEKCLGCAACAFLCPTCHCFDIQECSMGKKGSRFRCWDTCQFEKFTLMGAGHNPRPSKKERTRQRVFHKFKYSLNRYGMLGCVGCGRCIAVCPVNIDIRCVIADLEKSQPKKENTNEAA